MGGFAVKRIAVLGSTGSIGTQTLDVCRRLGYEIVALAAGGNAELLEALVGAGVFSEVSCRGGRKRRKALEHRTFRHRNNGARR